MEFCLKKEIYTKKIKTNFKTPKFQKSIDISKDKIKTWSNFPIIKNSKSERILTKDMN